MAEFSGYLIFNQIHQLRSDINLEQFGDKVTFQSEEKIDPIDSEEAIEEIFLPARTVDEPVPREFLRILDEEVRWFRYSISEYREEKGLDADGEMATYYTPNKRKCDIFVTSDGYIFFKGPKSALDEFIGRFYERLDKIGISDESKEVWFDADFLLWLLYHHNLDNKLPSQIAIEVLTDAKVIGDRDVSGSSNRVSGSVDAGRSAPVLTGILRGKEISMLGGVFNIRDIDLTVDIESEGRVHIKSDHDISRLNSEGKIVSSIAFLREFCSLWEHWNGLESSEKYPPNQFFKEMYEDLESSGMEITFPLTPLIEEYNEKRGSN